MLLSQPERTNLLPATPDEAAFVIVCSLSKLTAAPSGLAQPPRFVVSQSVTLPLHHSTTSLVIMAHWQTRPAGEAARAAPHRLQRVPS